MAQVRQDNVQIKLEIDGSQSKTELDNLTRKAQVLQQGLKEMKRGTDEYIAANKELRQVNTRIEELRNDVGLAGLSLSQLSKYSKQLNRDLADLVPGTESFIAKSRELAQVEARLAEVRGGVRQIKDELDATGSGFGDFFKKAVGFAGIQLGVEAVVSSLVDLGKESVGEFEQAQGAAAQLQAALTSTGGAAGLTKQELLDLSTALEGKTILDGDAITQAQSVLLTFTKIKKGVYEEALPAIVDMATRLGGDGPADLQGATIQVGKALNDPVKGITALAKAGVSFSEDQKQLIKTLVETGDVAGAQKLILQELANEFGGSAEAAAKAGTGPLKQFQVQVGNVKEGLGELIVDGLQALQPVLAAGLQLLALFIEALKATPAFLEENRGLLTGLAVALLTLNARNIATTASTLALNAVEKGRAIATTASATAQRLLNAAMSANPVGLVIAAVALLVGGLVTLYERSEKVREVVAGLGAAAVQVFQNIKDQAVAYLSGLGTLLAGIFTFDPAKIKAGLAGLGDAFKKTGAGVAAAYHQGYAEREQAERAAEAERARQAQAEQQRQAKEAADKAAAVTKAASLEQLKEREANIQAALALVAAGSAEELRLKKLEVTTKRDIDLLDEKKTAADKKVIRAEALRDLHQLQEDYDKKQSEAAKKRAQEQADVEKRIADLRAAQIPDEEERKIAQLTAAAQREMALAKGTAEQIAEQRKLLLDKLAVDVEAVQVEAARKRGLAELEVEKLNNGLIKNEFDRKNAEIDTAAKEARLKLLSTDEDYAAKVKAIDDKALADHQANERARLQYHQEVLNKLADMDEEAAAIRREKRVRDANGSHAEIKKNIAEELAMKMDQLDKEQTTELASLDDLHQKGLISDAEYNQARLGIVDDYLTKKQELGEKARDAERAEDQKDIAEKLGYVSQFVSLAADLQKIGFDKQLTQLDKEKKQRLAKLDAEYKAGTISKEQYESGKSDIETSYDEKTRAIKQKAAERDKEYQIANSIIQGTMAVLSAAAANAYSGGIFSPVTIATGIAALAATAKIIATPIPEFEQGGFFGRAWRGVKQYARGGRHINPVAGVAGVGQRHSSGGIRMVDGATGEHLGEWERGEAYMILSRDTYANNKHLIDELIDTSLYRGGAPVRPQPYYEDGGTFSTSPATSAPTAASSQANSRELIQAVNRVEKAIQALPSWVRVQWDQDDTAELEQRLDDRARDRENGAIR